MKQEEKSRKQKLKREEKSRKLEEKSRKLKEKSLKLLEKSRKLKEKSRKSKSRSLLQIPSADSLLRLINLRKRHITSLFMEVLECASVEANTLNLGRNAECKSPTRNDAGVIRTKLRLGDLVE